MMQNASLPTGGEDLRMAALEDPALLRQFAAGVAGQGYRRAACTALRRAAWLQPRDSDIQVQLGQVLLADRNFSEARDAFRAALALAPQHAGAWRGLGTALLALDEVAAAEAAFRHGFATGATEHLPPAGAGPHIGLLVLVSVRDINLVTAPLLDPARFAVTALYVEYADRALALPPHQRVLNAIADADSGAAALARAEQWLTRTSAPVINRPEAVRRCGRAALAETCGDVPGLVVPRTLKLSLAQAGHAALPFPYILRAAGCHAGRACHLIRSAADLRVARGAAWRDGAFAIAFHDTKSPDGYYRKYRVMLIDGDLYPVHLVHGQDWKVHGFSAPTPDARQMAEEAAFLTDMHAILGPARIQALKALPARFGLDYLGVDFALGPRNTLILFEANPAMTLLPPRACDAPPARLAAIGAAREAARRLLARRS